jgi:hypothetical protein
VNSYFIACFHISVNSFELSYLIIQWPRLFKILISIIQMKRSKVDLGVCPRHDTLWSGNLMNDYTFPILIPHSAFFVLHVKLLFLNKKEYWLFPNGTTVIHCGERLLKWSSSHHISIMILIIPYLNCLFSPEIEKNCGGSHYAFV